MPNGPPNYPIVCKVLSHKPLAVIPHIIIVIIIIIIHHRDASYTEKTTILH